MKKGIKKIFGFVSAGVLSLASIFSLSFALVKNECDLSLQNASISNDLATHGGGGRQLL